MSEVTDNKRPVYEPKVRILLKQTVIGTCIDTTMHGIPNILKENSHIFLKVIWIICLLTCTGAGLATIIKSIQQYFSYPSYISTSIIEEIPTQFPAVSFCNMKSVNSSTADGADVTNSSRTLNVYTSLFEWLVSENYILRALVNNNPTYTADRKKSMGYQIENMLVSCYFNYLPCYASDFTYFYHPLYGNCYTFNAAYDNNGTSKQIKSSSISGYWNGLILEFFVGNPSANTQIEFHDGVILSIQNQTDEPFWQGDILKASAGSETDFIVNRNFITKLPSPYGNCVADPSSSPYYSYIVNTLRNSYSEEFCFLLCIQDQIIKTCGCADVFLPTFNNASTLYCFNSLNDVNCMKLYINNFSSSVDLSTCKTACPFECNSTEFRISSYQALYPTSSYIDILYSYSQNQSLNLNYNEVAQAFTKVNIYYHTMQYTTTVQTAQLQLSDLMANIGGNLGLFLGMSFLTFAELLEISFNTFVILVKYFLARKKNANKINNTEMVNSIELPNSSFQNFSESSLFENKRSTNNK